MWPTRVALGWCMVLAFCKPLKRISFSVLFSLLSNTDCTVFEPQNVEAELFPVERVLCQLQGVLMASDLPLIPLCC